MIDYTGYVYGDIYPAFVIEKYSHDNLGYVIN